MKTKELVNLVKRLDLVAPSIKEEITQRLMEFDELKRVIHDTVDTAIELYSFLFGITGEFE